MATTATRLVELSMVPQLAKEIAGSMTGSSIAVAAITPIATADATDLATAITLANATKAKFNSLLTALKA